MAATPEKKVKDKIVKYLKEFGVYYFYPVTGGYGSSGVPDIVACYRGLFIGIEVKADAKKRGPTKLQQIQLQKIDDAGGISLVIDNDNLYLIPYVFGDLEELNGSQLNAAAGAYSNHKQFQKD